ncbi:MAG: hypothetical protein R3266_12730, partial [Gemmatimonadota bacterium]|nr:hypothetical protein [Gemmatimonadota bacterium]
QGVYRALLGARLAASVIESSLADPGCESEALAGYERALDRELRASRALQRLVDHVVSRGALMNLAARLLRARPALASRLIDATGDRLGPSAILDARAWLGSLARRPDPVPAGLELPLVEEPRAHP